VEIHYNTINQLLFSSIVPKEASSGKDLVNISAQGLCLLMEVKNNEIPYQLFANKMGKKIHPVTESYTVPN
jgi:hypothetical protein